MNSIIRDIFWSNWWIAFGFSKVFTLWWAVREYLMIRKDKECTFHHVFMVHSKTVFENLLYYNEYKKKMLNE